MSTITKEVKKENVTSKFAFPVKMSPIQVDKKDIPNKFAVVREDNGETLGIVSGQYGLLKHETVVNSFRNLLKGQKFEEKIEVQRNGALLFTTYTFKETQIEVKKGDFVSMRLVAKNSYDGTRSFQMLLGAFRLVCSNGMIIGKEIFSFNQKHYADVANVDSDMLKAKFGVLSTNFGDSLKTIQVMTKKTLPGSITTIVEKEFEGKPFPAYLIKTAVDNYDKQPDKTVWGYYNALTASITHSMKKDAPSARIDYSRIAWDSAINLVT